MHIYSSVLLTKQLNYFPAEYSNYAALGGTAKKMPKVNQKYRQNETLQKNVFFKLVIFTVWLPWPARAHTHVGALENILSAYAKDGKHWIHT